MNLPLLLGIGVLGGLGAVGRFVLDRAVSRRLGSAFPWGTLVVNLLGALLLGILVGAAVSQDAYRLAGTGVLGAFTTFSAWMLESHRLSEGGGARLGALNILGSLAGGIAAVWLGRHLGAAL